MKKISVKNKVILQNDDSSFGPGICELLEHINRSGSIRAAAGEMSMSYKKAWNMINRAEGEMGCPFLERVNGGKKGGSSTLTEQGQLFVKSYRNLERRLQLLSEQCFEEEFTDLLKMGE